MGAASAKLSGVLLGALLLAAPLAVKASPGEHAQTWLAVSDIHLDPFDRSVHASGVGKDSNAALFESALAQMKRAVPNPSLVLLPGDFLEHHFAERFRESGEAGTADRAGIRTMQRIASAFGKTFPRARFAVALGNNDAPCGDYRSAGGTAYLARVSRIWMPLVDRDNAAPRFAESFARNGYYTLDLGRGKLRLIVLNTVLFSQVYRGNCGGSERGASKELEWLRATLRGSPAGSSNVVVMHIPPGFDPFSTRLVQGLVAWPFLKPSYARALAEALSEDAGRVAFAVSGHAHRFDFRLLGNVPLIVLGSLSPILHNNPAFYALHLSNDATLQDIDFYVFDESLRKWLPKRGFDASWGTTGIDASSLTRLHARLAVDPAMRRAWGAQSNGWPLRDARHDGAWETRWWRLQWCAQTSLAAGYARCSGIQTRIDALRIAAVAVIVAAIASLAVLGIRRRVHRR